MRCAPMRSALRRRTQEDLQGLAGQPWDAVSEFPAQGETLKKVGEREWRKDEVLSECMLLF